MPAQGLLFMEHFAGCSVMTETLRKECGPGARLDSAFHRGMDILTPAGYANLIDVGYLSYVQHA